MIKHPLLKLVVLSLVTCVLCYLLALAQNQPSEIAKRVEELKAKYDEFVKTQEYTKAVTLCQDALKELDLSASPNIKKQLENWLAEAKAKRFEALVKQWGSYKGMLDKPGADKEKLPWEKAREKETDHFLVKTNLSIDALNDICLVLEYAYLEWLDLFKFPTPQEKGNVSVLKNRTEFEKLYNDLVNMTPGQLTNGVFIPKEDPRNKSNKDYILTYYYRETNNATSCTLLHESTHYALSFFTSTDGNRNMPPPPIWLDEGLATCFASSRIEGKKLVADLINHYQLPRLKASLNNKTYLKLKDFINLSEVEYRERNTDVAYPEGWGLIYFLINGVNKKYQKGIQKYLKSWKDKKIDIKIGGGDSRIENKDAHIKLFEQCMGTPINELEKEWKEYILKLK